MRADQGSTQSTCPPRPVPVPIVWVLNRVLLSLLWPMSNRSLAHFRCQTSVPDVLRVGLNLTTAGVKFDKRRQQLLFALRFRPMTSSDVLSALRNQGILRFVLSAVQICRQDLLSVRRERPPEKSTDKYPATHAKRSSSPRSSRSTCSYGHV